MVCATALRCI